MRSPSSLLHAVWARSQGGTPSPWRSPPARVPVGGATLPALPLRGDNVTPRPRGLPPFAKGAFGRRMRRAPIRRGAGIPAAGSPACGVSLVIPSRPLTRCPRGVVGGALVRPPRAISFVSPLPSPRRMPCYRYRSPRDMPLIRQRAERRGWIGRWGQPDPPVSPLRTYYQTPVRLPDDTVRHHCARRGH